MPSGPPTLGRREPPDRRGAKIRVAIEQLLARAPGRGCGCGADSHPSASVAAGLQLRRRGGTDTRAHPGSCCAVACRPRTRLAKSPRARHWGHPAAWAAAGPLLPIKTRPPGLPAASVVVTGRNAQPRVVRAPGRLAGW